MKTPTTANINIDLEAKLKAIRLLVLDVDGVLTEGSIQYILGRDGNGQPEVQELKQFNVKDGQGLTLLNRADIKKAIITARQSPITEHRARELGFEFICQGIKQKKTKLDEIIAELGITLENVAYMGDDLPDIAPLKTVGLPCCPADAIEAVQSICLFQTKAKGGHGAVRELTDALLKAQNYWPEL